MLKNFVILILKGFKYRTVRSWLTILGIVIGIMVVVIILALSSGIKSAITKTLQSFGGDLIIIYPGKETNPLVGVLGGQKFKERDLMNLEKIRDVKFILPMGIATVNVHYKGETRSIMAHAANWEKYREIMEASQGMNLETGQWPQDDTAQEVIFGYLAAKTLFQKPVNAGEEITIKSKRFKVVGTISEIGEQMADNVIYLSLDILHNLTGIQGAASAFVKIMPKTDINLIAQQVRFELAKQKTVEDFSVLTPDKVDRLVGNVLAIIEMVLMIIALVSLVVGSVGVMNTMYTSVLERTRQIGVMKAIGASSDAILSFFLLESGLIGAVGGLLGIILGIIAAYALGVVAAGFGVRGLFSFGSLDFFGFFVILVVTFITGVIAGILPARQAANLEPAEALRYE